MSGLEVGGVEDGLAWRFGEEFVECAKVPRYSAIEQPFDWSGKKPPRWVEQGFGLSIELMAA